MDLTRTTGAFDTQLSVQAITQGHQAIEDTQYKTFITDIQKSILTGANKGSIKTAWDFPVQNPLSDSMVSRIILDFEKVGFNCQYTPAESGYDDIGLTSSYVTAKKVTLSLPNSPKQEVGDGYLRDSWEPEFRASKIQAKVQAKLSALYLKVAATIQNHMQKYPTYQTYTFDPAPFPSIIIDWLKDELNGKGFRVSNDLVGGYSDISCSHSSYKRTCTITNPLSKSYDKCEIYFNL